MELTVESIGADLERGTVIITGYDVDEIISNIGTTKILESIDYSELVDFVAAEEKIRKEDLYEMKGI